LLVQGYEGMKKVEAKVRRAPGLVTEAVDRLVSLYDEWAKKTKPPVAEGRGARKKTPDVTERANQLVSKQFTNPPTTNDVSWRRRSVLAPRASPWTWCALQRFSGEKRCRFKLTANVADRSTSKMSWRGKRIKCRVARTRSWSRPMRPARRSQETRRKRQKQWQRREKRQRHDDVRHRRVASRSWAAAASAASAAAPGGTGAAVADRPPRSKEIVGKWVGDVGAAKKGEMKIDPASQHD